MIQNYFTKNTFIRKLTVMCLVIGLSAVGPAYAGPRNHRHQAAYPAPGKIIRAIPSGHALVHVGPNRYYYSAGVFYRKGPKGYAVVRAPLGAVVMHLPVGYRTMMVAGVTYFFFAGLRSRRAGDISNRDLRGHRFCKQPFEADVLGRSFGYPIDISAPCICDCAGNSGSFRESTGNHGL